MPDDEIAQDDGKQVARNAAMVALARLRVAIRAATPHLVALPHVHGLLVGLVADLARADDVLKAGGGADLLDRVRLLLEAADEGQFPVEGALTAGMVSDMVMAAREASMKLSAFLAAE